MVWHITIFTNFSGRFSDSYLHAISRISVFDGCVAFFFVISGYFAARKTTWSKAVKRALWLFIPFFLWNLFYFTARNGHLPTSAIDFSSLFGLKNIFSPRICINKDFIGCPVDAPSWFLRDLLVLTLLTPICIKFFNFLPGLVLIFACSLKFNTDTASEILLSPSHIAYYLTGICLSNFSTEAIRYYLLRQGKYILGCGVLYLIVLVSAYQPNVCFNYIGRMIGTMLFLYLGIQLEDKAPKLSRVFASWGPSTFLAYLAHWPLYQFTKDVLPQCYLSSYWMMMVPVASFLLFLSLYHIMKKFTPWILPYVAYTKAQKRKEA